MSLLTICPLRRHCWSSTHRRCWRLIRRRLLSSYAGSQVGCNGSGRWGRHRAEEVLRVRVRAWFCQRQGAMVLPLQGVGAFCLSIVERVMPKTINVSIPSVSYRHSTWGDSDEDAQCHSRRRFRRKKDRGRKERKKSPLKYPLLRKKEKNRTETISPSPSNPSPHPNMWSTRPAALARHAQTPSSVLSPTPPPASPPNPATTRNR